MTWSFSLKERVDDQDQWALARLTSPGVPQLLCTSVNNIVLVCTGWAVTHKFEVVLLNYFTPPCQKVFLVSRHVRGPSKCTEPAFSREWRDAFTLLSFHECFLRFLIKKQIQGYTQQKR